jgi:hypothetical protein
MERSPAAHRQARLRGPHQIVKIRDIHRFFEDLNRRVGRPVEIVLTGGAAAILQGTSRATFDIDFELRLRRASESAWDQVQKAIAQTSTATGIAAQYGEDIDQWSAISLPGKESRLYRRFGKVEVRILNPGLWAIGKLARYLSSDVQDLRVVLKAARTRPKTIARLWGTALGISPASSSQVTFRRQVEDFIDQYSREIWGAQADSAELKRLFLETAQRARRSRSQ